MSKAIIRGKVSMDGKEVDTKLAKARQSAKSFASGIKSIGPAIAGAFATGIIGAFISKIVQAASVIEDYTMQFKILLQSQKEARAMMAEIKKFSAGTPFKLGDLAEASQQLLNFSEGTMGGVESLTLFGDAAAATGNKDLPNVTYWVGRLYAALKTGRPFIDSANSLQRLKIMAPSTVSELMKMREEGKSGAEMWDVFTDSLKKYEGGMKDLSETVSGKTSTMKDNWALAWAEMGEALKPFTMWFINFMTEFAKFMTAFSQQTQRLGAFLGALSMGEGVESAWKNSQKFVDKKKAADKSEREFSLKMQGETTAVDEAIEKKKIKSIKGQISSLESGFGKSSDSLRSIGAGGGIVESNVQQQLKLLREQLRVSEDGLTAQQATAQNTENIGGLP